MNVLLLCSQGMSTGMLCEKITQAAKEDGKSFISGLPVKLKQENMSEKRI